MPSASLHKIAIVGASGRMGQMLVQAIAEDPHCELVGALEQTNSPAIGRDAGALLGINTGVTITADANLALANAQYLIDFTRPEATLEHLNWASARGIKMVIGTTGFDAGGKAQITEHSKTTALVFSANMSVGVNATMRILELAAQILNEGFDVEISEAHHKHKVDAPSGTALMMGDIVAKATGRNLEEHGVFVRHGVTGARAKDSIGFSVIRAGDIVGDHTVLFSGIGERIEISHKSSSRMTYALGALRACQFLASKATGQFDMSDVLGLTARRP
jgi:4-hydroxy-tetrahydrodipicolinate reductase